MRQIGRDLLSGGPFEVLAPSGFNSSAAKLRLRASSPPQADFGFASSLESELTCAHMRNSDNHLERSWSSFERSITHHSRQTPSETPLKLQQSRAPARDSPLWLRIQI